MLNATTVMVARSRYLSGNDRKADLAKTSPTHKMVRSTNATNLLI
jgi:hypothetical protein